MRIMKIPSIRLKCKKPILRFFEIKAEQDISISIKYYDYTIEIKITNNNSFNRLSVASKGKGAFLTILYYKLTTVICNHC